MIDKDEFSTVMFVQLIDYFLTKGKQMKSEYIKRMRDNKPIKLVEIKNIRKKINKDLDLLMI
jgi:hypothetical protein